MDRESIFQIIRSRWNQPPVDVRGIIEAAGIDYHELRLPSDVSGMIERGDGRYRIVVNASDSAPRRRFTAAHELGHYVYHRGLIGEGVDDNRLYRSNPTGRYKNAQITQAHETEANRFAANLLMPKHLVDELQRKKLAIPDMAKTLGVSVPAMRVRLGLPAKPTADEWFEPIEDEDSLGLDGQLRF